MNSNTRQILAQLFDRFEKNPNRKMDVTFAFKASQFSPFDLDSIKNDLCSAEKTGAIKLEYGRLQEKHLIRRIRLCSVDKLALFLGEEVSEVKARNTIDWVKRKLGTPTPSQQTFLENCLARWRIRKKHHGLEPDPKEKVLQVLLFLNAIEAGLHEGLDMRTFSRRTVNDSKALENLYGPIASVFREMLGLQEMSADLVFEALGLKKFPHPVLVAGPLYFSGYSVPINRLGVYMGIAPANEYSLEIQPSNLPPYILTIENLASFNRYVREISDNSIIIYTGGFPSKATTAFLKHIDHLLPYATPWFHWGDIDEGGLFIFDFITKSITRPLHPHLMSETLAENFGSTAKPSARLKNLNLANGEAQKMVTYLSSSKSPKHLEQEHLDPTPPIY